MSRSRNAATPAREGDFLAALEDLNKEKGMDTADLRAVVENALAVAYKRTFQSPGTIQVRVQPDGGLLITTVVEAAEVVEDPTAQVGMDQVLEQCPDARPGDVVELSLPTEQFARLAAQTAKHAVSVQLREAERDKLLNDMDEQRGLIMDGIIQKVERDVVYIDLGRVEGILPPEEQIPGDDYVPGRHIKVLVQEALRRARQPQVQVSRASRQFILRLLEFEVPEIASGQVVVRAMAREAGLRTKLAVSTDQPGLDAVGACVGPKGVRIRSVVGELGKERVDVVGWSDDPAELVSSALNPATVLGVVLDRETKTAEARVPSDQLSLAIGKDGQNARLAAKLTGWRIDIKPDPAAPRGDGNRKAAPARTAEPSVD